MKWICSNCEESFDGTGSSFNGKPVCIACFHLIAGADGAAKIPRESALFYKAVGERVKLLRASKKLSQRHLAERVGCSDATICWIEQGKQPSALHTFLNIALVLGVSLDLLTGQTN